MTNIAKLTVSLTKHGAHKIAYLLKSYDKDTILQHLSGSIAGVNIEEAQTKKNLSVDSNGVVPSVWNEVRSHGENAIDALVLIAIIFSHYKLISVMAKSSTKQFCGKVIRDTHLDGKEYTNFAHILDELGYAIEHTHDSVSYNLQPLFDIDGLNKLALKVLKLKLISAGWDQSNSIIDEIENLKFHEVFSLSSSQLKNWLRTGQLNDESNEQMPFDDEEFFLQAPDITPAGPFQFVAGHNERKTGTVEKSAPNSSSTANLLHNEIQNSLYTELCEHYGEENVGTEIDTGYGTSIDVVVSKDGAFWFYEIKTASTVKACIRQALPQLLEYAYWPNEEKAQRLIVVSQNSPTDEAETYLNHLRENFSIPIYYEQHDIEP